MEAKTVGRVGWIDLTIDGADEVRDFYADVVGWTPEPVDMGEYSDYNMLADDGAPAVGVCHRRSMNAEQPGGWVPYFLVADLDASIEAIRNGTGEVLGEIRRMGDARWCLARDPAGTPFALWEIPG